MNLGEIRDKAKAEWNSLSERDKLIALGAKPNYTGDDAMGLEIPESWGGRDREKM